MSILKPKTEVTMWVPVNGFPGFEVHIQYLTPADLKRIRDECTKKAVNKQTRQVEDKLDTDQMARRMVETMILDWKGLTVEHLKNMMPLDIESENMLNNKYNGELPFGQDELKILTEYTYSRTFMDDITEMATDMSEWRKSEEKLRGN